MLAHVNTSLAMGNPPSRHPDYFLGEGFLATGFLAGVLVVFLEVDGLTGAFLVAAFAGLAPAALAWADKVAFWRAALFL